MDIKTRPEKPKDYLEVEMLTYKAFIDLKLPGREVCDEHFLVHKLRNSPAFIPELDYVVEYNEKVIGNIMYSKSKVVSDNNAEFETITYGPVSVLPEYQKKGIGSALIRHTIDKAKSLGYKAIFIFGHPQYYPRFGFVNAAKYCITTHDGENFDAFMVLELQENALSGIAGKFYYDEVFNIDRSELDEFNKKFKGGIEL